jgi:hypothetical protein
LWKRGRCDIPYVKLRVVAETMNCTCGVAHSPLLDRGGAILVLGVAAGLVFLVEVFSLSYVNGVDVDL